MDLQIQRKISQAIGRFFLALQAKFQISDREMVMLSLASAWGQSRKIGMTNAQLLEWALKNWGECEREIRGSAGNLIVTGQGADLTKTG